MNVLSFYRDLLSRGFQFQMDGNQLKCRGTREPLFPELTQKLKHHKPEIMAYLSSDLPSISTIQLDEATNLFKQRGWIQIYSTYLDQNIYFVRKMSIRVPNSSIPKYIQQEIEALKGLALDELRTIHEAKKVFGGSISDKEKKI